MKTSISLTILLLLMTVLVNGQGIEVSGKVTDSETSEALIGATVAVQGTTDGTVTDVDGNYRLTVADPETVLQFSYIGYETVSVPLNGRTTVDIQLNLDIGQLDEVVVIGYGTQRERDLTSAVSTLKTEDLTSTPTNNALQSLQGKVAGVQITNNGAPGAAPNIRIRGLSALGGEDQANPLFVVDGMFVDNIDFLNTADIESMSILKDAAAASIYGVRGANGVVLIETKGGSYNTPVTVTYNGYYGVQRPQNVLQMTNAEQYVNYVNATGVGTEISNIQNAFARYGRSRVNPNVPDVNTDWYGEVMRDFAPMQNHSLGISGGNESLRYSIGTSYFQQEGLLSGIRNDYERFNLRANIDAEVSDKLSVGGNVILSNATQFIGSNAIWSAAYNSVPILPVRDANSSSPTGFANAQDLGYRGVQNPFFPRKFNDDRNNIGKILGSFYAKYEILPNLSVKTSYQYFYQNIVGRNVDFAFDNGDQDFPNGLRRRSSTDYNQIWDNLLVYDNYIGEHGFTITAGYSYRSEVQEGVQTRAENIETLDPEEESTWYIPSGSDVVVGQTFDFGEREFGSSYFGRLEYNYAGRYLVYGSYRRDGTNKFSDKWGDFFTIGGGWVLTEESFFNVSGIDFLKIRGGWGQTGNDGIAPAIGQPTFEQTTTIINGVPVTGILPNNLFDLVDSWETTNETNIGLSGRFFQSRLNLEFDIYRRVTKDAVLPVLFPGTSTPVRRNAGEIRNQGIELSLGWSDAITNSLSYRVSGNLGINDNEVLSVGQQPFRDVGGAEFRQRSAVGSTINEFFGYEIVGVFQSAEEINNSGYTPEFITANNLVPGDFFFKDQNNDGVIDADDRAFLGGFVPTYTWGFNLGLDYKNWSFTAFLQGQGGNKILNRNRGTVINTPDANIDKELATGFWDGPGSSNRYPSAAGYRKPYNHNPLSEFLVEDGDYFRLQNVRLAYNFTSLGILQGLMKNASVYVAAERPITIFDYNGFNPEVTNGVDSQTYPVPAVYTVGIDLTF